MAITAAEFRRLTDKVDVLINVQAASATAQALTAQQVAGLLDAERNRSKRGWAVLLATLTAAVTVVINNLHLHL